MSEMVILRNRLKAQTSMQSQMEELGVPEIDVDLLLTAKVQEDKWNNKHSIKEPSHDGKPKSVLSNLENESSKSASDQRHPLSSEGRRSDAVQCNPRKVLEEVNH